MSTARFQHTVQLSVELEEAWKRKQEHDLHLSFNAFVIQLLQEALCATAAPTSTIPSAM
jgi:hypothetical protein